VLLNILFLLFKIRTFTRERGMGMKVINLMGYERADNATVGHKNFFPKFSLFGWAPGKAGPFICNSIQPLPLPICVR